MLATRTPSPRPARRGSDSAPSAIPSCTPSSSTGAGPATPAVELEPEPPRPRPRPARPPARIGRRRRDQGDTAPPQARRDRRDRARRRGRPHRPRPPRGHRLDAARPPAAHRHLSRRRHLLHRPHRPPAVVEPADLRGADRAPAIARAAGRHPRLPAPAACSGSRPSRPRTATASACSATVTRSCGSRTCAPIRGASSTGSTRWSAGPCRSRSARWIGEEHRAPGEDPLRRGPALGEGGGAASGWRPSSRAPATGASSSSTSTRKSRSTSPRRRSDRGWPGSWAAPAGARPGPAAGAGARLIAVKARVLIRPKEGILDPQGKAVERALPALGFEGISHVRVGRMVELEADERRRPGGALREAAREPADRGLRGA